MTKIINLLPDSPRMANNIIPKIPVVTITAKEMRAIIRQNLEASNCPSIFHSFKRGKYVH